MRTKKTEVALCLFNRASQASRPGFRLAPQVVSLHPRWVANCYWCRLSATLFYLSTLPPVSPSLPSAVGRSSVPVGIGNNTKTQKDVNAFFFKKIEKSFPHSRFVALGWDSLVKQHKRDVAIGLQTKKSGLFISSFVRVTRQGERKNAPVWHATGTLSVQPATLFIGSFSGPVNITAVSLCHCIVFLLLACRLRR